MHKAIIDYLLRGYDGLISPDALQWYERELYRLSQKELAKRFLDAVRLQGC